MYDENLPDTPTEITSERMRRIPRKGTKIEITMCEYLNQLEIEFDHQVEIAGSKPDFRLTGTNTLIFCDSSFWHGRRLKDTSGETFNRNKEFWAKKLLENKKRDMRINRRLRRVGWSVHRFWDTDILNKPEKVLRRLRRILEKHQ